MRKFPVLLISMLMTGCATVPQNAEPTTEQEVRQKAVGDLVKTVLVLGAVLYVANEVADNNRNKQCVGDKILYRSVGGMYGRLNVCPGKLP